MSNFNYQKAYCVLAVPAFNNLPNHVKQAHSELLSLVGDLRQDRRLNTPLNPNIIAVFDRLTTKEIAELSRASYFVGHWKPSELPSLFNNSTGEAWKVSNCADQILRQRIKTPSCIQIHEGKFRVTFSSMDCWLWEEFSLATEENLNIFKECGLPFWRSSLHKNALKLKELIGDLWPDVGALDDNDLYLEYRSIVISKKREKINCLLQEVEDKAARVIEEAKIQTEAFHWLLDNGFDDLDNVIYYQHKKTFCFGWRTSINKEDRSKLLDILCEFPFEYEIK